MSGYLKPRIRVKLRKYWMKVAPGKYGWVYTNKSAYIRYKRRRAA